MASLEELLQEEGFQKRRPKPGHTVAPGASRTSSLPLYRSRDENPVRSALSSRLLRRGNTFSVPENGGRGGRIRRQEDQKEIEVVEGGGDSSEFHGVGGFHRHFRDRISAKEAERHREVFSDELWETEGSRRRRSDNFREDHERNERPRYNYKNNSRGQGPMDRMGNENSSEIRSRRRSGVGNPISEPALDEAAIQAVVSILSGYIRHFVKEESFRKSIRRRCSSFLGLNGDEESHHRDSEVITNLREAIRTVERGVVKETQNIQELRRAALQLSVIGGLDSENLKDDFTSGMPNSRLAACAHLYLSVICKLQKKNRVSAKHLLQVFIDAPLHARVNLLVELWETLFFPHLSHLRIWYDNEAKSIVRIPSKIRKMKLLEETYNDALDNGTYQFAVYYKEWLREGGAAPEFPHVPVPSMSNRGEFREESDVLAPERVSSPTNQPMISKKLYNSVFSQSKQMEVSDEIQSREDVEEITVIANGKKGSEDTSEENETVYYSPKVEMQADDRPRCVDASFQINDPEPEDSNENILSICAISENLPTRNHVSGGEANELILKNLAVAVFQQIECSIHLDVVPIMHPVNLTEINSYQKRDMAKPLEYEFKDIRTPADSIMDLMLTSSREDNETSSFYCNIPKDFICPLTGQLFEDPVTIETGQTFELVAFKSWLDQGHKSCPITGRPLECLTVPVTNFVLKRIIDGWKSGHCRNILVLATQITGKMTKEKYKSKDEVALLIVEQLLRGFHTVEWMENARHLISLGGLQFLITRFELGNLEEKTRIVGLLSCCIEAEGNCRSYLARNMDKSCILELLHSKKIRSRKKMVSLLIELICLNRRTETTAFIRGLHNEEIDTTMHSLLLSLQNSLPEERPLVAVLLLNFAILNRRRRIYREEAVDAITDALDHSLTDEVVLPSACRGLMMLGGHFSLSGEASTDTWLLKQAGFYDTSCNDSVHNYDETDEYSSREEEEEEEKEREEWQANLTVLLLSNGRRSFLDTISRCLGSGQPDLMKTCLTTVAWLSQSLISISNAGFQLSAFSSLISDLKESLENDEWVEHRVLASISLHNFSKIPECRILLMTFAEEIQISLSNLVEITWTAKRLCNIIFGEHPDSERHKSSKPQTLAELVLD